jgi:tRNA-dihydrouridine synthase B
MTDAYERFELMVNGEVVRTPIAIASMAGWVDADYVLKRADHVGAAFIGGYSIDAATLEASRKMAEEGRREFVYDDPVQELRAQIDRLAGSGVVVGLNLRGSSPDSYRTIAEALGKGVIYEIDAHCRQQPMIDAGCGEYLLHHPEQLAATIGALKSAGAYVSVKIRAGVTRNDPDLARSIWKAGADMLHVDLMDFGYAKIRQIRNSCPLFLIANNSINTFERMKEMLSHGADMVSLARQSDQETLATLDAAVCRYADEQGWYNAPKQLCRGGDLRALTFCCMPVKDCPLLPALKRIDMPRGDYIALKQTAVEKTPLAEGENTCFGSLAWCCKSSTPCMFRDITLRGLGLTHRDYMRYKHRLAEKIMEKVFEGDTTGESG